jgi:hypothetical protein
MERGLNTNLEGKLQFTRDIRVKKTVRIFFIIKSYFKYENNFAKLFFRCH